MTDEAIKTFHKASELAPDYSLPHTNLGTLYANMGRIETAIKEFKISVSLNAQDAGAWMNLYSCYKEVGLMEESQKAFSKYEALMNDSELAQAPGGDNPSNIPGGVSQTSKLATGGDMREDSAGLESLRDVSE